MHQRNQRNQEQLTFIGMIHQKNWLTVKNFRVITSTFRSKVTLSTFEAHFQLILDIGIKTR